MDKIGRAREFADILQFKTLSLPQNEQGGDSLKYRYIILCGARWAGRDLVHAREGFGGAGQDLAPPPDVASGGYGRCPPRALDGSGRTPVADKSGSCPERYIGCFSQLIANQASVEIYGVVLGLVDLRK